MKSEKTKRKSVAVICEYNPFHFGHQYQIDTLKRDFDTVVGIMSGNAVQRGGLSVADKYSRAAAAVSAGADIILSLPFPHCVSSASDFARAGIYLANRFCNAVAFGAEDGEEDIRAISEIITADGFGEQIRRRIAEEKNISYPRALCALIGDILGAKYALMAAKPNNILALEYLNAIKQSKSKLEAVFIKREMKFESSGKLREKLDYRNTAAFCGGLPDGSAAVYRQLTSDKYFDFEALYPILISKLLISKLFSPETVSGLYDLPYDLYHRIKNTAAATANISQIIDGAKNACYTAAHVRRALTAIIFDIKKSHVKQNPQYTMLLAANKNNTAFLNTAGGGFPLITKPADYRTHKPKITAAFLREINFETTASIAAREFGGLYNPLLSTPRILSI